MRLEKLELKDFQAHDELVVAFSPTITTIVGPSDSGKSAILRALRWTCLNDLAGDEFIKEGAKQTAVKLQIEGDHQIIRSKGTTSSGHNTYKLDDREYRSFAQTVPSDIAKALALSEINFQGQHDNPFWFSETAGEVSRRLNAVVDLSVIDQVLSSIAAEVRQATERKTISNERLAELREEFNLIKSQENRVVQFQALRDCQKAFVKADENCDRLAQTIERIRTGHDQARTHEERWASAQAAATACGEAVKHSVWYGQLSRLIDQIKTNQAASTPPPDFKSVEDTFEEWRGSENKIDALDNIVSKAEGITRKIQSGMGAVKGAQTRFDQATQGKRCPLCQKLLP